MFFGIFEEMMFEVRRSVGRVLGAENFIRRSGTLRGKWGCIWGVRYTCWDVVLVS